MLASSLFSGRSVAERRVNFSAGLVILLLSGCAAEPDKSQPGSCQLSCGNSRVAGNNMKVVPMLSTPSITLNCDVPANQTAPTSVPITLSFQIYEDIGGDGTSATNVDYGTKKIPRAGIGFEPMILGQVATEKTNLEFYNPETKEVKPSQFAGIVTPSSEWCSDACGDMKYDVWPVCRSNASNTIQAGIAVQGIIPEGSYNITIENSTTL